MRSVLQDFSASAASAGALSALVGFASSFPIVVQGLINVGATPAQAASGLMAASMVMGLCAIFLSLRTRAPIAIAWSTPGAAFLATIAAPAGGFAEAVGAFLVTAALIVLAGLWKPLGRAVTAIPRPLASGMLAGVLLPLCLAPFQAVAAFPAIALPIIATWLIVGHLSRLLAVPAAVAVAAVLIALTLEGGQPAPDLRWPAPVLVMPELSLAALTGIAIPLFIITMAAQNVTGIAVLSNFGYRPDPGRMFSWTGLFSLLGAPFGSHGVNLAAITAALCAGEEVHPDPARRYWAAMVGGAVYLGFGLLAGWAVGFMQVTPTLLITAVAGLALFGALGAALHGATADPEEREAALITFLVTASGLTLGGIGGAFWGLLAGGLVRALRRFRV